MKGGIKLSNEVLEYIGLNLNKEYKNLKFTKPEFNIAKSYDNSMLYKVYKMLPIKDIEILVSYTDRTTEIKERYLTAKPWDVFIKENETEFLELVAQTKVEDVEQIEKMQKEFEKHIPYFIKYDKNYLWQIYYSNSDKKYFMLVPAREGDASALFYLIKKKLENSDDNIYVPICKEDYSDNILKKSEITDFENYIWLFTKQWPNIYEVENKLYITGVTQIQEGFESKYKIALETAEEAESEFTLFKALFILATETNYKFDNCIDDEGRLRLKYEDEIIQIDNLSNFITKQASIQKIENKEIKAEIETGSNELDKLKKEVELLTENYRLQEKQIVMFLNCKKSFFKKLKYFFKKPVKGTRFNLSKTENNKAKEKDEESTNAKSKTEKLSQGVYNLSDLVKLCLSNKKINDELKNIKSDIFAMKNKKSTLEKRVKNAKKYLDEIEKHKKSIFEFWKFAKKDEDPALNEGEEVVTEKKLSVDFNVQEDMPEFSASADSMQKQKLSIDECNSIFVCKYVLDSINAVRNGKNIKKTLERDLTNLQDKYVSNKKTEIFGDIEEDYTKVKNLNNKKHRENRKNVYSILRINDKTTIDEFRDSIEDVVKLLNEAYKKITAIANFSAYYVDDKEREYVIAEIDPKKINFNDLNDKIVYKTQMKMGENVLYFSNITNYDNYNQTLPSGMDEETKVLIKNIKRENKREVTVNVIDEEDLYNIKINKIKVVEWYD